MGIELTDLIPVWIKQFDCIICDPEPSFILIHMGCHKCFCLKLDIGGGKCLRVLFRSVLKKDHSFAVLILVQA